MASYRRLKISNPVLKSSISKHHKHLVDLEAVQCKQASSHRLEEGLQVVFDEPTSPLRDEKSSSISTNSATIGVDSTSHENVMAGATENDINENECSSSSEIEDELSFSNNQGNDYQQQPVNDDSSGKRFGKAAVYRASALYDDFRIVNSIELHTPASREDLKDLTRINPARDTSIPEEVKYLPGFPNSSTFSPSYNGHDPHEDSNIEKSAIQFLSEADNSSDVFRRRTG